MMTIHWLTKDNPFQHYLVVKGAKHSLTGHEAKHK